MIIFKDVNYACVSVVIPAVPAPLQQGAVAPECGKVSHLGPVNTYFKSHFLGMGTCKFKKSGVRPRPKTYAYVTVRRTDHGQLCLAPIICMVLTEIVPMLLNVRFFGKHLLRVRNCLRHFRIPIFLPPPGSEVVLNVEIVRR